MSTPEPFRYDAEVEPGERRHDRYEVGETYLGDPVEVPVTSINGEGAGPTVGLVAALHGDVALVHQGDTICTISDHF